MNSSSFTHPQTKPCESFTQLKNEIKRYMTYYNHYRYQLNIKKMTSVDTELTFFQTYLSWSLRLFWLYTLVQHEISEKKQPEYIKGRIF